MRGLRLSGRGRWRRTSYGCCACARPRSRETSTRQMQMKVTSQESPNLISNRHVRDCGRASNILLTPQCGAQLALEPGYACPYRYWY